MPDLGKYVFTVLASYGVALGLIALLVLASLWSNRRAKAELEALERDET